MLTGKCKEGFERHYLDLVSETSGEYIALEEFYKLPISMQFGCIVDYADSIGYDIVIQPWNHNLGKSFEGDETFSYSIHRDYNWLADGCDYSTLDESRKAAIKKFNELMNEV